MLCIAVRRCSPALCENCAGEREELAFACSPRAHMCVRTHAVLGFSMLDAFVSVFFIALLG